MADQYTVFDFDETLYIKDSLIVFHLYCVARNPLLALWFPFQFAGFLLHRSGLISTQQFKNLYLLFLAFYSIRHIEKLAETFWKKEFPKGFNPAMLDLMNESKNAVIITASPLIYFHPLIKQFPEVVFIGTQLKRKKGFYIIEGKNCKGAEKLAQFHHRFGNNVSISSAYSDSLSDMPLFNAAQHAFLIKKGVVKQLH